MNTEKIYNDIKRFFPVICSITLIACFIVGIISTLTGCREADRASYNISREADNFNIVRRVTVIDCFNGDVLFQMTGRMSIYADNTDHQLEVTVADNGTYQKHIIGLSDNVTYVVEDLNMGTNDVSAYRYTIIYNPKMWLPVNIKEET